ncbi:MAG: sarcosine oxidase subunit delta family protein [Rhizobiaceae bacterium]
MIITCPYCGPRDVVEFTYQGDATAVRPDQTSTDQDAWNRYVYDRANPAGKHSEVWQHSGGCRAHLVVERDTLTHAIGVVRFAREKTAKAKAARPAAPAKKAPARKPATKTGARRRAGK